MSDLSTCAAHKTEQSCWFCGNDRHPHNRCLAREEKCYKCERVGHFRKVCRDGSTAAVPKMENDNDYYLAITRLDTSVAGANSPFRVCDDVLVNDTYKAQALIGALSVTNFLNY